MSEAVLNDLINNISGVDPGKINNDDFVRLVFVIPSNSGYGMNIYRLGKSKKGDTDSYQLMDTIYENYENESAKSFFDGRR